MPLAIKCIERIVRTADGVLERQANSDVFAVNQSKAALGEEAMNKAMTNLAVGECGVGLSRPAWD